MSNEEKELDNNIKKLKEELAKKGINTKRKKDKKQKKQDNERRRLENKLMRVITKAGVSWASWSSLVEIADTINGHPLPFETAAWIYNEHTKQERIVFTPKILKELPVNLLILVLKHELLHKSMYRGTQNVGNLELLNFALDASINKILWLSNPKQAAKLGSWIVPPNSDGRSDIHAVLNPDVRTKDLADMDTRLRSIVEDIWWVENFEKDFDTGLTIDKGRTCCEHYDVHQTFGNHKVPDPLTLYNKLAALLSREQKEEIKKIYSFIGADEEGKESNAGNQTDCPRGGPKNIRAVDKNTIDAEKRFANEVLYAIEKEGRKQDGGRYRGGKGYSAYTDMHAFFEQYVYSKKNAETEGLNDFINRWETLKQVEGICHTIHNTFRKVSSIEPFPNELTRTGLELVALDVSGPDLPYFFNIASQGDGAKKKVCCYFDCSPSMDAFIPYMLHIVDYIDGCEEAEISGGKYKGRYIFSEKVKGIPENKWEDFKQGEIRGGCGTSFEAVALHAIERIENDQVDIILVFTDGFSYINEDVVKKFNDSGKKCYTIYFSHGNYTYGHSRYRHRYDTPMKSNKDNQMTSDLDKLDGQGFTIWCENK